MPSCKWHRFPLIRKFQIGPSSNIFNSYFFFVIFVYNSLVWTPWYKEIYLRCIALLIWHMATNNGTRYVIERSWARPPPGLIYFPPHEMSTVSRTFGLYTCMHTCIHTSYDQRAGNPLDPTAVWHSHLLWRYTCLLLISMLWHRQAIFESKGDKLSTSAYCRIQTQRRFSRTESPADWIPADRPTELSRIELKIRTRQPSLWSASMQPTRPHCCWHSHLASGDIHVCVVNFDTLAQPSNFRIESRQIVFLCWMQDSKSKYSASWMVR